MRHFRLKSRYACPCIHIDILPQDVMISNDSAVQSLQLTIDEDYKSPVDEIPQGVTNYNELRRGIVHLASDARAASSANCNI